MVSDGQRRSAMDIQCQRWTLDSLCQRWSAYVSGGQPMSAVDSLCQRWSLSVSGGLGSLSQSLTKQHTVQGSFNKDVQCTSRCAAKPYNMCIVLHVSPAHIVCIVKYCESGR